VRRENQDRSRLNWLFTAENRSLAFDAPEKLFDW